MLVRRLRVIIRLDPPSGEIVARRRALALRRNAVKGRLRLYRRQARFLLTKDGAAEPDQDVFKGNAVVEGSFAFNVPGHRACAQVEGTTNAVRL